MAPPRTLGLGGLSGMLGLGLARGGSPLVITWSRMQRNYQAPAPRRPQRSYPRADPPEQLRMGMGAACAGL